MSEQLLLSRCCRSTFPPLPRLCSSSALSHFAWEIGVSREPLGRIAIGLGLTLLALHILVDTLAPAEEAPLVRSLLAAVTHDPVFCIVIAAALTWAAHSSVAVVLLIMSLAYSHFVSAEAALALVLGANLGSAINPVLEGASSTDPDNRRLPIGNLINRLVGVLLAVPLLPFLAREATALQPDASKMVAEFHMVFNIAWPSFSLAYWIRWHGYWNACYQGARKPPIHRYRAIWMMGRSIRLRSQSQMRRAKRCAWGTTSKLC